jgi:hypothetical protein
MSGDNQGKNAGDDYRKVMQAIEEYVFQNHKFPSKTQVADLAGIPPKKCDGIIDRLKGQKKLSSVAGGGKGIPEIVLPYDMMQAIIMQQAKPDWVAAYAFPAKGEIDDKIRGLRKDLVEYDMYERLLYYTDTPLEEAVAFTLGWLGLKDVEHHLQNKDYADVTFEHGDTKALIEVYGTTKQGDKEKVLQLEGWVRLEIDKEERDQSKVQGFLAINHFREDNPSARGDPLTKHWKTYLKHHNFRFFTTYFLFTLVKQVKEGTLTKEQARDAVWKGEEVR